MKLCYRGVFYEYDPPQPIQSEAIPRSVRVLRYRGLFYIREMQSSHSRLTGAEVVHSPNDNTRLEISNWSCVMQIQRMGILYKRSVRNCRLRLEKVTVLQCEAADDNGSWKKAAITLDKKIVNDNGQLTVRL
jgi:hypothetical protein